MLDIANYNSDGEAEILARDIGHGLPFRAGVFDAAISISAVQWLCYSHRKAEVPIRRLNTFFQTLYSCLKRGARAVLQFYPENSRHVEMITSAAMRCGFIGGIVVDFPNSTNAKKHYLVIDAGKDISTELTNDTL